MKSHIVVHIRACAAVVMFSDFTTLFNNFVVQVQVFRSRTTGDVRCNYRIVIEKKISFCRKHIYVLMCGSETRFRVEVNFSSHLIDRVNVIMTDTCCPLLYPVSFQKIATFHNTGNRKLLQIKFVTTGVSQKRSGTINMTFGVIVTFGKMLYLILSIYSGS